MYFKECLRKVEFIFVGENLCRMSIFLKEVQKKFYRNIRDLFLYNDESGNKYDNFDIWMISFVDRYKGRFYFDLFEKMCFVNFCLEYVVLYELQLSKKINKEIIFKFENDMGYIRKRIKLKLVIIRYFRFLLEIVREKYF